MLDQGANHQLGRYALELGADRAEEVRAAAGHDADGGFSSAEFVDQLEHREVAHPARVVTQHRVPRPHGEVANQLGELLGSQIGEQIRQRERDAGANIGDPGRVAASTAATLWSLGDRRVSYDPPPQLVDGEVVPDVGRSLASQRAVVVEVSNPRGDRHILSRFEEPQAVRPGSVPEARTPTHSRGSFGSPVAHAQRNPMWLIPVSTGCGRRGLAGSAGSRSRRIGASRPSHFGELGTGAAAGRSCR